MRRFVRLMAITVQGRMYYRASFFLNLTTPLILLAGQFLLWRSLYGAQAGGAIGSFAQADMFSYILLAFGINNLLTWSSENVLSREIRSGEVIARRIRPVPFLSQTMADMTGNLLIQAVVNGAAVVLAFVLFARWLTPPAPGMLVAFVPSLLLAILLRMMLVHSFSLLCFFTTGHLGLTWTRQALTDFFSGALIPVALFPAWLQSVTYVLPFPLMLQIPIAIFLGQPLPMPLWQTYALQVVWIFVFFGLHVVLYGYIRKNTTLAGG